MLVMSIGCWPMVFEFQTCFWFNKFYVTTEIPPPEDLETIYEVGNWSWNWMEPPLGTISFFILCMQMVRNQVQNLGLKPYNAWVRDRRAARILTLYPQYNKHILENWSQGDPFNLRENKNTQI